MLKFTISKSELLPVLARCKEIADGHLAISITKNAIFSTLPHGIIIGATDLDISYEANIPCEIENAGSLIIDAKRAYEITKLLPEENITFEEMSGEIAIKAEVGEYKFLKSSPDDFPLFPSVENKYSIELLSMADVVNKLAPFVDHGYARPVLTGIHIESKDNTLWMVGTDGRRMGIVKREPIENPPYPISINIPWKGMLAIKRLAEKTDKLCLQGDENLLSVASGNEKVIIRLIEGDYPDFYSVIPKETENRSIFTVNKQELVSLLKRIAIFFPDKYSSGIMINANHDGVRIEALSKEIGDAREKLELTSFLGDPFEVAINGSFLFDSLRGIKSDEVSFGFNGEGLPCVVRGGEEDKDFISIIMPMQYKGVEK